MRNLCTAAVGLAGLLVPLTATVSPAAAAVPTCEGRPATVVGAPGQAVIGTGGPDVVVASNPASVDAGAGDDLVCVSVAAPVLAAVKVRLGAGADTYLGSGNAATHVNTGDLEDVSLGRVPSRDVVTTGTGGDQVGTGAEGYADDDVVTLGAGGGVVMRGWPAGAVDAGPRVPGIPSYLFLRDDGSHAWDLDLALGTARVDGAVPTTMRGFSDVRLTHLTWSSLSLVGSARRDYVDATGPVTGRGPFTADLGGGRDQLDAGPALVGAVEGGAGRDLLLLDGERSHRLADRLRLPMAGLWTIDGTAGVRVSGVESVAATGFRRATVTGTPGADRIDVAACRAVLDGGSGDDHLTLQQSPADGCRRPAGPFLERGGPGDDRLVGTDGPDTLLGGPGSDVACRGAGPDRIRAEVVRDCRIGLSRAGQR